MPFREVDRLLGIFGKVVKLNVSSALAMCVPIVHPDRLVLVAQRARW